MAGFSGAVEDGIRNIGMVVSLVASVIAGRVFGSFSVGLGVFVAGYAVTLVWAHITGENFRARQFQDTSRPEDPDS